MIENFDPQIDRQKCTGCGDCVQACPSASLELSGGAAALQASGVCTYCGTCERICQVEAVSLPYQVLLRKS